LQEELDRTRFEIQRSRLQLATSGVSESLIPKEFRSGGGSSSKSSPLTLAIKELIEWLAEKVDSTENTPNFRVGDEIPLGADNSVTLGRMAAFNISASGGQLLSVPFDLKPEIAGLLSRTRSRGNKASDVDVSDFVANWDMLITEVPTAENSTVPAIFLVEKAAARAIVVAAWPLLTPAPEPPASTSLASPCPLAFDPCEHFKLLTDLASDDAKCVSTVDNTLLCVDGGLPSGVGLPKTGERVEVNWEGTWLTGVLVDFATEEENHHVAHVACDVDEPGVMTVVSIALVRRQAVRAMPRKAS
jgi:hypothetical protein